MRLTLSEAQERYGVIQDGSWVQEAAWCVLWPIPAGIAMLNAQGGVQKHIYCNKDIIPALTRVFNNVISRGLASQLKTFDGCLMIRDVRAEPGKPSCHSYACAVDFNAATNQLGDPNGDMSPELVKCFKDENFSWGGDFHRIDKMHFSLAWE